MAHQSKVGLANCKFNIAIALLIKDQSFSVLTRTGFSMSLGFVYDHRKGYDGNYFDINYSKYIILMKRTRLLDLKKDMFRQLLCYRQFTVGITMMNNM